MKLSAAAALDAHVAFKSKSYKSQKEGTVTSYLEEFSYDLETYATED